MNWFSLFFFVAVVTTNAAKIKAPLIVNGEVATEGQFPWQVGVVSVRSSLLQYCGGAIISKEWILTAAHCIYGVDEIVIMYDTLDLEDINNKVKVTKHYLVHENYDPDTLKNDVGLVFLEDPLVLEGNVAAIPLAEEELQSGTVVTVSGWGTTGDDDNDEKFDVLRYINVTTIENKKCMEAYGTLIDDRVVCTAPGNPPKNPCKGDGGDPVVVEGDHGPVLVALFSFLSGLGCERLDFPAGYVRVGFYREWIRNLING